MVGIGTTITIAKKIVPKSNFFIFCLLIPTWDIASQSKFYKSYYQDNFFP
jgi:hypothetical protein